MLKKLFLSTLTFLFFLNSFSQDIESITQAFPNALAVTTKNIRELKLAMKNGEPTAQSTTEVEMLMLSDKANGIYNRYKVFHGSFNQLSNLEAYTKVPDGNKLKKIKVTQTKTTNSESSGVFYDDVKETSFDFPSLTKGAIANVSYTEFHKDIHMLSPFYFFTYTPALYMEYSISFPSNIEVKYIVKNNENGIIKIKEDKKGKQQIITFYANNVKERESFSNGPSISYSEPHVIIYVASYQNTSEENVNVFKTLKDFYKWNYHFLDGINQTNESNIKQLADSLTAHLNKPIDKAKAIYKWVQEHIKYVAFEDGLEGFIPRQATDVCNKRYGDCKDMSSLITALLKAAGLNAYFTWIGTRSIAYDYDDVHLPITDNHMISTLNIDNDWIFLDGTDPNCIFGYPTSGIQAKQALIAIDEGNYKVVRVPEVDADKTKIIDTTEITITDNGIKGIINVNYSGYFGSEMYSTIQYKDPKDLTDYIRYKVSKASNKFILGEYNINYLNREEKRISVKANFEVPDYSKRIGDEVYINMNLEKPYSNLTIDTAKRKVAYDNYQKYTTEQYTILNLPENYSISYIPKNVAIEKNAYSFHITYTQEKGKLIAKQKFKCNAIWLKPSQFAEWNAAIKELNAAYKEQVVLQKNNH